MCGHCGRTGRDIGMILDLVQQANEAVQEATHGNTGTVTLPQETTGAGGPIFKTMLRGRPDFFLAYNS